MTTVVIQPSYGNADARRHWRDTLEQTVDFTTAEAKAALGAADLAALLRLHPDGRAHFWGATSNHGDKFARLHPGDVVLFTGQKLVRGIGEIGVMLKNPAFGDHLWSPHPDRGSYNNVYSLRGFIPAELPYEDIWQIPGFNEGDNFMGLRVLNDEKSANVMATLGLQTTAELIAEDLASVDLLSDQAASVVELEAANVEWTTYGTVGRSYVIHRAESRLVKRYTDIVRAPNVKIGRLKTPVGFTDMFIERPDGNELVEAKSNSGHRYVRQALAQLIDYARYAPQPLTRVTALFPDRPDPKSVDLLSSSGIDVAWIDENTEVRANALRAFPFAN